MIEFLNNFIINISYDFTVTVVATCLSITAITCLRDYDELHTHPSHVFNLVNNLANGNNNNVLHDDKSNPLVVNLSKHNLTPAQLQILSRGLKFCPNPG